MIKVEKLSLTIKEHEILKNINHHFDKGKIHGLIGRNGKGELVPYKD